MQDRITTLEQSLRLKELGVEQKLNKTDFFYFEESENPHIFYKEILEEWIEAVDFSDGSFSEIIRVEEVQCKAFDAAQIDDRLSLEMNDAFWLTSAKNYTNAYTYCYFNVRKNAAYKELRGEGKTHIEAKTNLLIKLLENKIIEL
ncbi:MAG: hypothetical protein ACPGXZ_06030 [Saprospiraceae bacterium]